ncbi:hypothetical protein [Maribacter sp.]|uniref:hypothetical protein n=1 Tax=Maribacter sp. TaxID=1897614 RepID=UPI0025B93D08|nr:hypothetical protein [Maribacter sp.]
MPQQTVTVKETSPMVDFKRKNCMETINTLTDTELKNLETLLKSAKARGYLGNNLKFMKLKIFI